MPLPRSDQASVYVRKAVEAALRLGWVAPEFAAARRLRAQRPTRPPVGPRVLLVSPRDWVEHVQNQAMLGQALRMRGADVRFATCGGGLGTCDRANTYEAPPMPCRTCGHYTRGALDAHGFDQSALAQQNEWDELAHWPELDAMSVVELERLVWNGLALGELVDPSVKWFLCAGDVDGDPLIGHVRRAFLTSARRIAASMDRVLEESGPDVVVVLSGLFLFESVTWALCRRRGIDVVSYERAFRHNTLVFDREKPAGRYDLSSQWARSDRELTAAEDAELDAYLAERRSGSAFDQYWRFGVDGDPIARPEGRLAVLFTNVTWDSAVVGRDLGFSSIRTWLNAVVDEFARRSQDRLVIRVHPSETHLPGKRARDSLAGYLAGVDLPGNVTVVGPDDPLDSYALMEAADLGLVYTSTVGLELALGSTPVIVAGDTHYRSKGFTVDVSSPDELGSAITAVLADPAAFSPNTGAARRYAHLFFFRAPYRTIGVDEPIPGLARLRVSSLEDLAPGVDKELDRLCEAILLGGGF